MKKILIIGAGSQSSINPEIKGIGTCLVELLSKRNVEILFTYFKSKEGAENLKKIKSNAKIDAIKFNCLEYERDWKNLELNIKKTEIPNIFIYNAGIRFYKKILTKEEKQSTLDVNYSCPLFLINKIGNLMAEKYKKGTIIITSSILAGKHHEFLEEYCYTKGLLDKYIQKNKANWQNKGIEIHTIYPNVTITPMTEQRFDYYRNLVKEKKLKKLYTAKEVAKSIIKYI